MSKFGRELVEGMRLAVAHAPSGHKVPGIRVTIVKLPPDVKEERSAARLRMSPAALREATYRLFRCRRSKTGNKAVVRPTRPLPPICWRSNAAPRKSWKQSRI